MSELQHSIEIEGYWREMPSGRKVWVKSYKRTGTAREDDLAYKSSNVNGAKKNMKYREERFKWTRDPSKYSYGLPEKEKIRAAHEYATSVADYNKAIEIAEKYNPASVGDKIRYAAIDVSEEVQVAVGNFVEDAKANVEDIVTGAVDAVKEVVTSGWNAVKSFFSGLFGRR